MIANRLHIGQKMARKKQAHSLVAGQIARELEDLLTAGRVHAVGGLIKDQQFGIVHDGRRQLQPLLHAGRVGFHLAITCLAKADIIQDFIRPLHGIFGRMPTSSPA